MPPFLLSREMEDSAMWMTLRFCMSSLLAVFGVLAAAGSLSAADDEPVSGVFKGNGKEAKLAYVSTRKGEPFADKPTIIITFTEKDHSKETKPDIKAGFGDFGSALIITINDEGKIIGCVVAHAAHEKKGFSSVGNIKMSAFKVNDGKMQGRIATDGEQKTFGQTWEVDIKSQARHPKIPPANGGSHAPFPGISVYTEDRTRKWVRAANQSNMRSSSSSIVRHR